MKYAISLMMTSSSNVKYSLKANVGMLQIFSSVAYICCNSSRFSTTLLVSITSSLSLPTSSVLETLSRGKDPVR